MPRYACRRGNSLVRRSKVAAWLGIAAIASMSIAGCAGEGGRIAAAEPQSSSCRWSTWEAVRAGVEPRPNLPATIQERAWSSPIRVTP